MHLTPSDPDIATLYRKIKSDRLDLQPNFQRGEVWGKPKKQRLIDSILRGWHIPPIHVIQPPHTEKQEVLDGQQRLAAIRDFMEGQFSINGLQEPKDDFITDLNGLTWNELPKSVAARIEDFTIRVLTISDYRPGEPGELFYRLNQPTNLTSAEQRNAYFGEARQQVKELSELMDELGFNRDTLGFSNSRMAYDDVIAKFLLTLEFGTLKKKITANTVTSRYRESDGFGSELISSTEDVLTRLSDCVRCHRGRNLKLNKASTLSWMFFLKSHMNADLNPDDAIDFFGFFETIKGGVPKTNSPTLVPKGVTRAYINELLSIYQDRSSSRVADTASVILRDLCLWILYTFRYPETAQLTDRLDNLYPVARLYSAYTTKDFNEKALDEIAATLDWGVRL